MQWISSVQEALSAARSLQTPLLVLVEPSSAVQTPKDPSSESAKDLYSRVAARALQKYVFSNATMLEVVRLANLQCLRFPCEITNKDFLSFSAFFSVELPAPNLFIINPHTGKVLNRFKGYVSPVRFREAISDAIKVVSNSDLVLPQIVQKGPTKATPSSLVEGTNASSAVSAPITPACEISGQSGLCASDDSSGKDRSVSNSLASTDTAEQMPEEGGATSSKKSLKLPQSATDCQLRARLPDGQQVERVFKSDSKFAVVRSWLSEEARQTATHLTVATLFPRYVFSLADDAKFLFELSLCPSANLIVSPAPKFSGSGDNPGTMSATADNTNQQGGEERPWRVVSIASGVASLLSGLVRSTVGGTERVIAQTNTTSPAGNTNTEVRGARLGGSRAVRMTERRSSRDGRDDGQWMSNGNSTQFGWNSKDGDDDER